MGEDRMNMDHAIVDAGKYQNLPCEVCHTDMIVERNRPSHNNYVGAMSGTNRVHDSFRCPNQSEDWHLQARMLLAEAYKTPSWTLEKMFTEEAQEIVLGKRATKTKFY